MGQKKFVITDIKTLLKEGKKISNLSTFDPFLIKGDINTNGDLQHPPIPVEPHFTVWHMARKKVTLAWIQKDSARKVTYKKRKRGLLKKMSELSALCGVRACAVIYGPSETPPETWPPTAEAVKKIIEEFNDVPEVEKSKKMLNQESFMRQMVSKMNVQLEKLNKENAEMELRIKLLTGLQDGSIVNNAGIEEIQILRTLVEAKQAELKARNEPVASTVMLPHSMPAVHLPPSPPPDSMAVMVPMAPMPPFGPFPTVMITEEEGRSHDLYHDVSVSMDHACGEFDFMDFLVNQEIHPSQLHTGDNDMNWNCPPPQV